MTSRLEKRFADQRKTRRNRFLLILMCLLLFITVAGATYYWATGGTFQKARRAAADATGLPHKVNILVLGVDERSDDVGRSDTMFVVTVDTSTKQVSLLSIPRDTRVKIPGHGWDKINHAYAEGGHSLSQRAVEDLLGIPMDYYAIINFAAFNKIVDAVGGVTIDVEKRMYYEDPYDNLLIDLKPGVQKLDGRTAIQYVRYRDEEGDIGRIKRQQQFIKAMLKEVTSPFILPRLPGIIREVNSAVKTDMTTAEMLNLAKLLNDAAKAGLKVETVPGKPAYISDISYWLPDITALRNYVALTQGMTVNDKFVSAARTLATQYERSIPQEMKIVDVPKKPAATDKPAAVTDPKAPEKPKPAETPKTSEPKPPEPVSKLKVEIVNASGVPEAGDKMAATLRSQGYTVISIAGMSAANKNTVVIANSSEASAKLTGLPFNYVLQVNKDDSRANLVKVIIGKDYVSE
ncbi:Polyisoprenyl-teichoic acid--peptidoglycan teichoic acid transferase TagU [Sporomusa carbonis]|uniref:LCP family glycopolymer transferase n=1 Tax=Sporomusa carbonis TaxID=3076075 RepID=UPI003A64F758